MDFADVPVVDGHCHPFTIEHQLISQQQLRDILMFMQEGGATPEALDTLTAHLFIRELAGLLDCPPDFAEVIRARNQAAAGDYGAFVERVLGAAHATTLLVDTGYPYWKRVGVAECAALVTRRQVREVFRVESVFRSRTSIYFDDPQLDFGAYLERYRSECVAAVVDRGCVAFKTVIAYRTGLAVRSVSESEAVKAYMADAEADPVAQKIVRDYLFTVTAQLAAQLGVPLTIHTGFTGLTKPWSYGDPTSLVFALTQPEVRDTRFVLLHGGYPWGGAAGYMAAHHPNIYVDLSEVIPSTSIGIERHLEEVLEFAPLSKVMLGSDGLAIPELHWYGLVLAKRALWECVRAVGRDSRPRLDARRRVRGAHLPRDSRTTVWTRRASGHVAPARPSTELAGARAAALARRLLVGDMACWKKTAVKELKGMDASAAPKRSLNHRQAARHAEPWLASPPDDATVRPEVWQWDEATWRGHVQRVRAGRPLKPAEWPGNAQVAVALSFDSDHETIPLAGSGDGSRKLSQGEYGARVAYCTYLTDGAYRPRSSCQPSQH